MPRSYALKGCEFSWLQTLPNAHKTRGKEIEEIQKTHQENRGFLEDRTVSKAYLRTAAADFVISSDAAASLMASDEAHTAEYRVSTGSFACPEC